MSIRKHAWNNVLAVNSELSGIIKQNVLMEYITQVRCKVMVKKKKAIEQMTNRHDYQMILASEYKDKSGLRFLLKANISGEKKVDDEQEFLDYNYLKLDKRIKKYASSVESILEQVDARDQLLLEQDLKLQEQEQRIKALEDELASLKH